MRRKSNISRYWLVAIILTAYSGVYLINLACNIEQRLDLSLFEETVITGHDHHHPSSGGHEHKAHGKSHSHDNDAGDDNCCDDTAAMVYVSISNTTPPSLNLLKIDLPSIQLITSVYKLFEYHGPHLKGTGYLNKAPPLKIPDIRILIQSFLI